MAIIFGAETASSIGMCFAPGTEAQPGVVGIAGDHEVVGDGTALDVILGPQGPVGIDFAFFVSRLLAGRYKTSMAAAPSRLRGERLGIRDSCRGSSSVRGRSCL